MSDEEELPGPSRSARTRRVQRALLLLAALALAALVVVRVWPHAPSRRVVAPSAPAPGVATASPGPSLGSATKVPWPSAHGACGSNVPVPIFSESPTAGGPDVTVLVGGDRLRTLNLSSGRIGTLADGRLPRGEYVTVLAAAGATNALVTRCSGRVVRILRIGSDGTVASQNPLRAFDTVLTDGSHTWLVVNPRSGESRGYLMREGGGARIGLPPGFFPESISDGIVVGSYTGGSVLLVDATNGRVLDNLGAAVAVAVGHGEILWTDRCDLSATTECGLHRRPLRGSRVSTYPLPRPPGAVAGALSPDGRTMAFALSRATQDPRYDSGHPIPPSQIAVLDLRSGRLRIVPGVEVPAKSPPSLIFSPDGRWLLLAFNQGPQTSVIAWRPGLARPVGTAPIPVEALGAPPLAVLGHADSAGQRRDG